MDHMDHMNQATMMTMTTRMEVATGSGGGIMSLGAMIISMTSSPQPTRRTIRPSTSPPKKWKLKKCPCYLT